MNIMDYSHP